MKEKMNYTTQISIAGLIWQVQTTMPIQTGNTSSPFITETTDPDVEISVQIGTPNHSGVQIDRQYATIWKSENSWLIEKRFVGMTRAASCVEISEKNSNNIRAWIYPDSKDKITRFSTLLQMLSFDTLITFQKIVNLHSSLIETEYGGILFVGPSGVGKTTQADLWRMYRGADILNGDRSLIRKLNGKWFGYGSPFSGSSGIYRNQRTEILCAVVLKQAEQNSIIKLDPGESFCSLYSETLIPQWSENVHQNMIHLIEQFALEVPTFMLKCTPDSSAVVLLEQCIKGMIRITKE